MPGTWQMAFEQVNRASGTLSARLRWSNDRHHHHQQYRLNLESALLSYARRNLSCSSIYEVNISQLSPCLLSSLLLSHLADLLAGSFSFICCGKSNFGAATFLSIYIPKRERNSSPFHRHLAEIIDFFPPFFLRRPFFVVRSFRHFILEAE